VGQTEGRQGRIILKIITKIAGAMPIVVDTELFLYSRYFRNVLKGGYYHLLMKLM
jgi:hypothetical protein